MDPLCYLNFVFVFVMLSFLFLAAFRSPAGKLLTSWLFLCVMFSCVLITFQYGVMGRVSYLVVLIDSWSLPSSSL